MNPYFPVKEENSSSSYSRFEDDAPLMMEPPQPIEGLHDSGPPPFLTKTFDMVDDPTTNYTVSWSREGNSFIGFRKIDSEKWEFANEGFLRGQKDLLKNIRRRKSPQSQQAFGTCVEIDRFGLDGEVDRLRRDKQVLVTELAKLRQRQLNTRAYIEATEERLQSTERKQQQMMSFLARIMQNPGFLQQLMQKYENTKELEESVSREKRRLPIDQRPSSVDVGESSRGSRGTNPVKTEPLEFGGYGYQVTELEALALEMQGYGRARREQEEAKIELEHRETRIKELDEGFWEELLNEKFEEEIDIPGTGQRPKYRK